MKGIFRGYLNSSPFDALTLAMTIHITSRKPRNIRMGIPTIMKQRGTARTMYNRIESWKFRACFPLKFTHCDSSFLDSQQMSGPSMPPKGKKYPAKAARWQSIAQFLSLSDSSLISFMIILFLKDAFTEWLLHFRV